MRKKVQSKGYHYEQLHSSITITVMMGDDIAHMGYYH